MTWSQICQDKSLQDLPYKIETNRQGQIIMSPHKRLHSRLQRRIALSLEDFLPHGEAWPETAVETADGVKVADVAWISDDALQNEKTLDDLDIAPEICVEILSQANSAEAMTRKTQLYLEAGAREVWICTQTGQLTFFNNTGPIQQSTLCPNFPPQLKI